MRFDFGFSYRQNMPVIQAIRIHLPATLLLMVSSIALAWPSALRRASSPR